MGATVSNPTRRAMIKTGTYTGNDVDDRNIDIGVDLASKNNVYVIIKTAAATEPVHRIEYAQGDLSMFFTGNNDIADCIQAFTATGFQVGTSNNVNADTIVYRYIAFWEEP